MPSGVGGGFICMILGMRYRVQNDAALQSYRQKVRRAHGEYSQGVVEKEMVSRGYRLIEAVYTPCRVVRVQGRSVSALPLKKVSGDFRAVGPDGRSILVEVKGRDEGNLPWSAFADHQVAVLTEHAEAGGESLVAWVRASTIKWFTWPIP